MGNWPTLPYLDADTETLTLSGHGAGCFMAQQYSVIYSGDVAGVALFNCWPYGVDYSDDLKDKEKTAEELYELSKAAITAAEAAGTIGPNVATNLAN